MRNVDFDSIKSCPDFKGKPLRTIRKLVYRCRANYEQLRCNETSPSDSPRGARDTQKDINPSYHQRKYVCASATRDKIIVMTSSRCLWNITGSFMWWTRSTIFIGNISHSLAQINNIDEFGLLIRCRYSIYLKSTTTERVHRLLLTFNVRTQQHL